MKPLRLAVIFDQQIRAGGAYQEALNTALLTRDLPDALTEVVFFTTLKENVAMLAEHGIEAQYIYQSFVKKVISHLKRAVLNSYPLKRTKRFKRHTPFEAQLIREKIDLVYFLSPTFWPQHLEEINYITTIWDLCHRDHPEFPEMRRNRHFELRDKNFRVMLPRATAIFVDSELGRHHVVQRYGVDQERVHVMPLQAAITTRTHSASDTGSTVDVHEQYRLDTPYVFYPAQFWPHKNHVYLLNGLKALEARHGIKIGAIFSGGDWGNRQHVENRSRELGLSDRVRFTDFVPNEDIPQIYLQSIALVMPTYFGPTNLPPLEAFTLGIPVLYSDLAGLREQVGDAGLLMDLTNPESMADHIKALIDDTQLRNRLIQAGYARLAYFDTQDRLGVLRTVLNDFRAKRSCWD